MFYVRKHGIENDEQKRDVIKEIEEILRRKHNMVILWEENAVMQL